MGDTVTFWSTVYCIRDGIFLLGRDCTSINVGSSDRVSLPSVKDFLQGDEHGWSEHKFLVVEPFEVVGTDPKGNTHTCVPGPLAEPVLGSPSKHSHWAGAEINLLGKRRN